MRKIENFLGARFVLKSTEKDFARQGRIEESGRAPGASVACLIFNSPEQAWEAFMRLLMGAYVYVHVYVCLCVYKQS